MGVIIDIYGRRGPLIVGQLMLTFSVLSIPFFHLVYPWFFMMRTIGMIGGGISLTIPLMPDYVEKNSIGKASSVN